MVSFDEISFHDSSVDEIDFCGAIGSMRLDNVSWRGSDHELLFLVDVTVSGVSSLTMDGKPVSSISMGGDIGQVLDFERAEDGFLLLVQWRTIRERRSWTECCRFKCDSLTVELVKAEPAAG